MSVWVNGKILDTSQPKATAWQAPEKPPREVFGACADCGSTIREMDTIWYLRDRLVCVGCYLPYYEAGRGHLEPAGLNLPGITLEG